MPTYYDVLSALIGAQDDATQITARGVPYNIQQLYDASTRRSQTQNYLSQLAGLIAQLNQSRTNKEEWAFVDKINLALNRIRNNIDYYDEDALIIALISIKFKMVLKPGIVNINVSQPRKVTFNTITSNVNERYDRWGLTKFFTGDKMTDDYRMGGRARTRSKSAPKARSKSRSRSAKRRSAKLKK